ncbi:MAG: DUF3794 domain-containing protein [Ruminococcus sp.]|nr:DUF3794 domain-containing protein [Candidatus Apopatosoma intestinale]
MQVSEKEQGKFCVMTKVWEGTGEKECSEKYDLPDYLPDVNRLLRTEARLGGLSHYVNGDTLEYDGTVCYQVLYMSPQGEIKSADFESPISGSMTIPGYEDGMNLTFRTGTNGTGCRLQGPRKLMTRTKLQWQADVYADRCTEPTLSGRVTPEDRAAMQTKTETVEAECFESFAVRANAISEDIELPGSYPPIGEILTLSAVPYLHDARATEQGISYKGDILTTILYAAATGEESEEAPAYYSFVRKVPIDGELDAMPCESCTAFLPRAEITSLEYRPQAAEPGESRVIEMDFTYDVTVDCYGNTAGELVSDAYFLPYESDNEVETLPLGSVARSQTYNFSVNQSEENADPDYDRALFTSACAVTDSVAKEGGKLIFEGKAEVLVILAGESGGFVGKTYTVPFRSEAEAGRTADAFTYAVDTAVLSAGARADKEKVVLDLEIAIRFITFNEYEHSMIVGTTVYKDRPVTPSPTSRITVYYPSAGEDLWSIAKKYHTTADGLRRENKLSGDTVTGGMLIIPKS